MIFGVYLSNVSSSLTASGNCDLTSDACAPLVFNQTVRVNFEQPPVAEEELFLQFSQNDGLSIQNVWIEGVNMYMGKTPVLFEDPSQTGRAVTFLGSCNLSEMQWALYANIKNNATSEVALVKFTFSTYQD